jgi:hypothetical protein
MKLPEHLGGHANKTHLDTGVLKYMIEKYGVKTMLDIGCGPGGMVYHARELGIDTHGIDGDFTLERTGEFFTLHDYTTGPSSLTENYDMVWSCEFVEHVEEEYIPNFMPDFQRAKYVVMTFSEKNGHHHVNLKPASYWIGIFESYGFSHIEEETTTIRNVTTMNLDKKQKKQFVKNNGLFFVRN